MSRDPLPKSTLPVKCPGHLRRWLRFNAVGAAGVAVQASMLTVLVSLGGMHYLAATAIAVESAVIHNFLWHWRWTWADRTGPESHGFFVSLLRFHLGNGLVSLTGNLAFMRLLVGTAGMNPIAANLLSIALCSLLNFLLSDRWVFLPVRRKRCIGRVLS